MTLGRYNTLEEADSLVETLASVVKDLRAISPLGKEHQGGVK